MTCAQTTRTGDLLTVCVTGKVEHTESCALGCFSDQSRCNNLAPSNALGAALDQAAQQSPTTLPAGSVGDSETGAVTAAGTLFVVPSTTAAQPGGSHDGAPVLLAAAGQVELAAVTSADFLIAFAPDGSVADSGLLRVARDTRKVAATRPIHGAAALTMVAGTPWLASVNSATGACQVEALAPSLQPIWQVTVPGAAGDDGAILVAAGDRALLVIGARSEAGLTPHAIVALDARTGARLGVALPSIADGIDTLAAPAAADGTAVALARYQLVSMGAPV